MSNPRSFSPPKYWHSKFEFGTLIPYSPVATSFAQLKDDIQKIRDKLEIEAKAQEKVDDENGQFIGSWCALKGRVRDHSLNAGFATKGKKRPIAELLALIHSEVSEALEAARTDRWRGKDSVEEELADVVIRIMDTAAEYDLLVASAVIDKIEANKKRPYKHGKKF